MEYFKVHRGKADCALDIGDGSERAEYVCQDYVIGKLGKPHRAVNIMYTYYPKDKEWPARISEACKDMNVSFQWDYPYDDYFPYGANGEPFEQMKDIRSHGQDVMLTLTIDCSLEDHYLRNIARQLSTFGRMYIRINHECCGDWFTHNKRFSFKEISDFFVRFYGIIKEEAPNISVIFCAGLMDADGKVACEDDFAEAYDVADVWSADKYLALHYGWPYDVAEVGGGSYCNENVAPLFERYKATYDRLCKLHPGKERFITTCEMDADGDVTGAFHQAEPVLRFYDLIKKNNAKWFRAVSMYQFRDRGRLGLEIEDPNNKTVGIEQPLLKEYKKVMADEYFMPKTAKGENTTFPCDFRWGCSEDADGIGTVLSFEKLPEFCEMTFEKELALMIDFGGKWFYKASGVETIDFMPYFYENGFVSNVEMHIFSTPAMGENVDDGHEDWSVNYYSAMNSEPDIRIRYETPGRVG